MKDENKWFEIWFSDGEDVNPTYLLLVSPDNIGNIVIKDPFKKYETVFVGKTYNDVQSWLWEDDFTLSNGRVFV